MERHPRTRHGSAWRLWAGFLFPVATAAGFAAPRAEPQTPPSPPSPIVKPHKPKPRARLAVGDRWRVRASQLPMQLPDPAWLPAETWVFAVTGSERTPDGPRLIVTVTREGAAKPSVRLQLDPATQAIVRAETEVPVQRGERTFVERPAPGEPFVSEVSPVPIALPTPMPGMGAQGSGASPGSEHGPPAADHPPAAAAGGPPLFSFGPRYSQRTEPVDAGVGRAKIDSGMEPLKRRREAGLEPAGIPRFLTVIEGPGQRIEQVWDESTPWPLYSQTQTSRSWLVDYKKGM